MSPDGKLSVRRKEYIDYFNDLARKCTAQANLMAKLQAGYNGMVNAAGAASPGVDGSTPSPSPGATSPAPAQP